MVVELEVNKDFGTGDGYNASFDFYFKYFDNSEIFVKVDGVLIDILNYTITRNASGTGGTITFVDAYIPTAGASVLMYRELEQTQTKRIPTVDKLDRQTLEDALDKLTMLIQQNSERLNRSIALNIGDSPEIDAELASPIGNDGKAVIVAVGGEGFTYYPTPLADIMDTAAQAAEEAAASATNAAVAESAASDAAVAALAAQEAAENASGTFLPASKAETQAGVSVAKQVTPNSLTSLLAWGADVPSAATLTLPANGGSAHVVTGTTGITEISGVNAKRGHRKVLVFEDILAITSSSNLMLPSDQDITTQAGDVMEVICTDDTAQNWLCINFQRANVAVEGLYESGEIRGRFPTWESNSSVRIHAGFGCRSENDDYNIHFASDVVVDLDAGNGANKLDTGSPSNSQKYHLWFFLDTDNGDVCGAFSLQGVNPTVPSNYDVKRKHPGTWYNDASGNLYYQEYEGTYPFVKVVYPEQVSDAYGYEVTTDPMMVLKRGAATTATAVSLASRMGDSDLPDILAGSGIYSVSGVSYIYQKGTTIVRARLNLSGASSYNCNDQFEGYCRTDGSGQIGYKCGNANAPMSITIKGYKCNLYSNGL